MLLLLLRLPLALALLLGSLLVPVGSGAGTRSAMYFALPMRTDLNQAAELAAFDHNGFLHMIAGLLVGSGRLLAVFRWIDERVPVAGESSLFRAVGMGADGH